MLHMPTPMLMAGGKTYDDFVARITTLATKGLTEWWSNDPIPSSGGAYRTTATSAAGDGNMVGSVWAGRFTHRLVTRCFLIQHGLPTQEVFEAQKASEGQIFFRMASNGPQYVFHAYERNGYLSTLIADVDPIPSLKCTEILYWADGQAWKMQPDLGLGPFPYDW